MRAFPAFQVSISRFGLWRVAVLSLAALVILVMVAWFLTRPLQKGPWALAGSGLAVVWSLWLCVALVKSRPVSLRWDGQQWHLSLEASRGHDSWPGALSVVMDFGSWMLLRFQADAPAGRQSVTWLPVQRRGLEAQWHALRCAVYSARPAPGMSAQARLPIPPNERT